ncbi:hypothetical protein AWB81_07128 [Caballeronia arationis]|nr:hypothetical protein AWB81_07128 [Caballeronia arationis]
MTFQHFCVYSEGKLGNAWANLGWASAWLGEACT